MSGPHVPVLNASASSFKKVTYANHPGIHFHKRMAFFHPPSDVCMFLLIVSPLGPGRKGLEHGSFFVLFLSFLGVVFFSLRVDFFLS